MENHITRRRFGLAGVLCLIATLLTFKPVWAEVPPVELYGKLPAIERPHLSPDGQSLAYLASVNGRRCLIIHRLNAEKTNSGICPGHYEVRWFAWKNQNRLILEVYSAGNLTGAQSLTDSRLVAIDVNGRHTVALSESRAERAVDFGQDKVVDMLPGDPDHILVSLYRSQADSPDVVQVDIRSGRMRTVVAGHDRIDDWKTDGSGQVRAGRAVQDGVIKIYYRDDGDSPFRVIRALPSSEESRFSVLAVGNRPGLLYVASSEQTGRRAIYPYDVAAGRFMDAYASNPQVDIDRLIIDRGQPVGYSYALEEREVVFTDPGLISDDAQVAAALPQFHTTIAGSSQDGRRWLILAAGGNRPGSYFLLDRSDGMATLSKIGNIRPGLDDSQLAPVRPVTYEARDKLPIHAYVTLPPDAPSLEALKKPMPFVVLVHGGPSDRDVLGFDYLAQMIASRGYGVFQPNFRGSRGYGAAFEQAGFQQWGLAMQDDVTDGVKWLVDNRYADPKNICIVGWSYGGYAALMGAVKTPDLYRCAASMAGVSDLRARLNRIGQSRFADVNLPQFDSDPAVVAANSPVLHADSMHIPIFLAHGRRDFTVPVEDSEAMEAALRSAGKQVQSLYFDDDDHYLYREKDRIAFVKALSEFLAENLGPGFNAGPDVAAVN